MKNTTATTSEAATNAADAPAPVLYDPELDRGRLKGIVSRVAPRAFGVPRKDIDPTTPLPAFRPPTRHRFGRGVAHYGIMIPDLPPPHLFMANMTTIGYSGFRAFDVDQALQGRARDTANVSHGTAATAHDPFSVHGAEDCDFAPDGSKLQFGEGFMISGTYPDFRLRTSRPGFKVDLALTATGEATWFTRSPQYTHIVLMTRYQGSITHEGIATDVAGLCTFEYASGFFPTMIMNRPLPAPLKLPYDFFNYHVLNLDEDTQLLLAVAGMLGDTCLTTVAYERVAGSGSRRLGDSVRFEVIEFAPDTVTGLDGRPMHVPSKIRWTIREQETVIGVINESVDTQWLYAGMGNIAGCTYSGTYRGADLAGRGYLEYSDRRNHTS